MDSINSLVSEHLPAIKETFQNTVGAGALKAASNDAALEVLFVKVHKTLPLAVRMVLRKKSFVKYCFENRDKLMSLMDE